ncbi:MAG: hypothetical protein LBM00_05525 [Deltaproteobacteria bacterium]|nr:hypothetical protein [Deltaproteobacteria bacterium]
MELTAFYPIVQEHGLSKWWIYKQLSKLSHGLKRGVLPSGRSTASSLVPYEELMHLVLCASKKRSIENIIHLAWTVIYGRRMTHMASRSHGNWQRHYSIQRNKGRIAIGTPEDFFDLRPRFLFFKDNLGELETVMAPKYYAKLVAFLDSAETRARKYIDKMSKSQTVQQKLVSIDYEQFYHLMLDALIYGASEELAFNQALKNAPKRSDKGSSKEFITATEGAIESFAEAGVPVNSSPFKMDFEKLRLGFAEQLLQERMTAMKSRKRLTHDDENKACALAAEDMAILDFVIDGLTDAEILDKLNLTCTRQALTMRRSHIMDLAKEHFAHLMEE